MMIRLATYAEIDIIETLTEEAKVLMLEDQNPQWDHTF